MGTYIKLHVIPNQIKEENWREVYKETIDLLKEYKFATIIWEDRCILDKVEHDDIMWEVSGDLESREYGDTFNLKSDINQYKQFRMDDIQIKDILETVTDRDGAAVVFDSRTYNKKYHKYILAIACLIESRFPKFAMVSGDISEAQCSEAIEWANSILKEEIKIPVRVNNEGLLNRIKENSKLDLIEKFLELKIGVWNRETSKFIRENFNNVVLDSYFYNEIEKFNGFNGDALKLVVGYFKIGYSLEEIVMLLKEKKISDREIINGICDTWIFIDKSTRDFMKFYRKEDIKANDIDVQMQISINQAMFYGLFTDAYIEEVEGIKIFEKLLEIEEIEEIVKKKNIEILKELDEKEEEYLHGNEIQKKSDTYKSILEAIATYDMNEDISVKEELNGIVDILKEKIILDEDIDDYKEEILKIARTEQIILTRDSWKYIDEIKDEKEQKIIIQFMKLSEIENIKDVKVAILENIKFYEKYIVEKIL